MLIYTDQTRQVPVAEVFYRTRDEAATQGLPEGMDNRRGGWYWGSDPIGPFATQAEAITDATDL